MPYDTNQKRLYNANTVVLTTGVVAYSAPPGDSFKGGRIDGPLILNGAGSFLSLGTTPPMTATDAAGTGIFQDYTGIYGLNAGTQNFKLDATTGNITSISGTIGGWTISATKLSGTGVDLVSGSGAYLAFGVTPPTGAATGTGIFLDRTGLFGLNANTQNFKIDATNGNITAIAGTIGGWTISATLLTSGSGANTVGLDSGGTNPAIYAGSATPASAPFRVTQAGAITATSGTIGGWTLATTTLSATGIILDAGNQKITVGAATPNMVIDGANKYIRTSTYASGLQGFNLDGATGDAEFNNIRARGALQVTALQYGFIQATNGTIWVVPASGVARDDFTSVDSPTTFAINIKDPDGMTHAAAGALWAVNDIIRTKEPLTGDLWSKVSSKTDNTTYWTINVVKQSPGAGTNYTFRKGLAILNYGQSGAGMVSLSADGSLGSAPNITMATHAGSPWTTMTPIARMGNINGVLDYAANTYGFAFGDLSTPTSSTKFIAYDATNGLRIQGNVIIGGGSRVNYGVNVGDALMVCHYDGPRPYETDYSGSANGHRGQVATLSGGVIFRPGKFGKAVQVAEATTNLFADSSFETATLTTYWSVNVGGGTGVASSDTAHYRFGTRACKITKGTVQCIVYQVLTLTATSYTLSAYVYKDGTAVTAADCTFDFGSTGVTPTFTSVGDGWYLATYTATATASSLAYGVQAAGASSIWVDGIQLENKAYATPFAYFSFPGHTGSISTTSVRTIATLVYPTLGNISNATGTVSLWINSVGFMGGNDIYIFSSYTTWATNAIYLYIANATKKLVLGISGTIVASTTVLASNTQYLVTITWDGTNAKLYINGALEATMSSQPAFTPGATMGVGGWVDGTGFVLNGYVDDLLITSSVLSAAEINAIYTSNAPVVVESNISEIRLQGAGLGYVFGNANGLFGVDVNGVAQFGLTTGALNANLWGNNQSEVLPNGAAMLGSNASGYANMLWDPVAKQLKFRGATTTVSYIDTNGDIVTGGGNIIMNASGFLCKGSTHAKFQKASQTTPYGLMKFVDGGFTDMFIMEWAQVSPSITNQVYLKSDRIGFVISSGEIVSITASGLGIGTASQFGSGVGVTGIANATTLPTTNPSGGGVLYADAGAGKWRGSSGTVTTFGPADPHCPRCGADYMKEFDNEKYGYFSICLKCLADELGARDWIVRGPSRLTKPC